MVSSKDVAFFGGLQGDNSHSGVSLLNMLSLNWSTLNLKTNIDNIGRDDFGVADLADGSFLTFGGYVNGSRVNEVARFKHEGSNVNAEMLS